MKEKILLYMGDETEDFYRFLSSLDINPDCDLKLQGNYISIFCDIEYIDNLKEKFKNGSRFSEKLSTIDQDGRMIKRGRSSGEIKIINT